MSIKVLTESFDYTGNGCDLLKYFEGESKLFLLNSSLVDENKGQFSYLGFNPFKVYQSNEINAFNELKVLFEGFEEEYDTQLDFVSGLVGFTGYDFGLVKEGIVSNKPVAEDSCPHCYYCFYDNLFVIDHLNKKLIVVATGVREKDSVKREILAQNQVNQLKDCLEDFWDIDYLKQNRVLKQNDLGLTSNVSKEEYCQMVGKAQQYIQEGEIYQVNLSQKFSCQWSFEEFSPVDVYCDLALQSSTCFSSYFDCGTFQILSNSPERFVKIKDGKIITSPMKGTRPRGENVKEDNDFYLEILNSEKEKAELLMITDLLRNDLGRVAQYGSVKVSQMRKIEKYSTVFQAVSEIEGKLEENKTLFDVLQECLPAGSITGCPKIRSMQVIEELENYKREIYTGVMGYIGFSGTMDLSVLIRTLVAKENKFEFSVGGGIVFDSNAEEEYEETLVKAKAIISALKRCKASTHKKIAIA